jgi:DNA-directed RNA polymerase subunit RPC12/RpoP
MAKNNIAPSAVIIINAVQAKEIIHSIPDGLIFGMEYEYKHPKCGGCGFKSVKFQRGLDICPKCGAKVVFKRVTLAQKGVSNPANVTAPGQGWFDGISADEAESRYNLFKHYDRNARNDDGSRGGYRQADYDRIKKLKIRGVKYEVK